MQYVQKRLKKRLPKNGAIRIQTHKTNEPQNMVGGRKKPGKEYLYTQYKQPIIQSRMQKLAATQVLQQTTHVWKIHTKNQQNAENLLNTWKMKWRERKNPQANWEKDQQRKQKNSRNTNT